VQKRYHTVPAGDSEQPNHDEDVSVNGKRITMLPILA